MGAKVEWVGNYTFLVSGDSRHYTILDHADSVESQKGSSPTELLLGAMCGCSAMDVVSILKKKRENIVGLEVRADAKRAPEFPKVFTEVTMEYIVQGDVRKKSLESAISLSHKKYCHISIMLERSGVKFSISSKIIKVPSSTS